FGREERNNNLARSFYADLITSIEAIHQRLVKLTDAIGDIFKKTDESLSSHISGLEDVSGELILIDKCMIGRKEVERFLNYLLSPIFQGGDWKLAVPVLSDELKQRIDSEIAY